MAWHFSSDKAVYLQIAEKITKRVLAGDFKPGEQIPTVRQLALEAAVNPNTVQHAFLELEDCGLIISKGTAGRFVTEDAEIINRNRKKLAEKSTKDFIKNMEILSVSKEQIIALIEEVAQ